MNKLRDMMNLFESMDWKKDEDKEVDESECAACDDPMVKEEDDTDDEDAVMEFDTAGVDAAGGAPEADADVDSGLDGMLDARSLAKLLPEVDDVARFVNAVHKVQKGDLASLSMQETRQMAKAFVSLLMDDTQTTMKALQKLKAVHTKEMDTGTM